MLTVLLHWLYFLCHPVFYFLFPVKTVPFLSYKRCTLKSSYWWTHTFINISLCWDRHPAHDGLHVDILWSPQGSFYDRERHQDPEEEKAALQCTIKTLKSQIAVERSRREAAERESELTIRENTGLEQRLAVLDGCRARQKELEAEVEQLRLLWRADCANR